KAIRTTCPTMPGSLSVDRRTKIYLSIQIVHLASQLRMRQDTATENKAQHGACTSPSRSRRRACTEKGYAMKMTLNTAEPQGRSSAAAEEEALLKQWEPLARYLAQRFAKTAEREDLEQVARLGLLRAARRFDPAQGVLFRTYAAQTIVGQLRHYI